MNIQLTYDSSVANAPSGFTAALAYVVNFLDSTFNNPVTINIDVGWGEIAGDSLDANTLGESQENEAPPFSYSQVRGALLAHANSTAAIAAATSLPASDPTGGGTIDTGTADAKALGLLSANASSIDGWIGFTSQANTFTFDPGDRAVFGEYDFVGVALHEITEVMGRDADLGDGPYFRSYTPLDLFRYLDPGTRDLTTAARFGNQYFSVDGGANDLDNFNTNTKGDLGDWASSAGNDSFLAFSGPSVVQAFTAADLATMEAIGWTVPGASANPGAISLVEQTYSLVLARQGNPDEIATWTSPIDQGTLTDAQMVNDIVTSSEARSFVLPVVRLYQAFFGRVPDPAGLSGWVNALHGGESLAAVGQGFAGAPEFQTRYGVNPSPTAFVTALYENVLGRAPDSAGEQGWLAVLGSRPTVATEAQVALGFSQSAEFIADSTGPIDTWLTAAATSGAYGPAIAYGSTTSAAHADVMASVPPPSPSIAADAATTAKLAGLAAASLDYEHLPIA